MMKPNPNQVVGNSILKVAWQELEILENTTAPMHTDANAAAAMDSVALIRAVTAILVSLSITLASIFRHS